MSLLEVDRLEAGYGKLTVLHGISLAVEEGEIVAIVGPNGAGKSTLMKALFRLLPTSEGEVRFDGKRLSGMEARQLAGMGMGFVPQEANTFPDLSVEENINVALLGQDRKSAAAAREAAFKRFPILEERRRQSASTLSGGERQMLALAGATVSSPRLLGLDEPTTGLAPSIVDRLIEQILEFRANGSSVLWVIEENPLQILHHVDRVYLIQGGVIDRVLPPKELLADDALRQLFFGVAAPSADART